MNSSEKNAILLGAGQFGRGVIAMLLERAGYHVLLADLNQSVIDDINERKQYTIRRVDDAEQQVTVKNISAMNSRDPAFADACADSDLICTCVGLTAIPKIAPVLAESIRKRCARGEEKKINILACENAIGGSTVLKREICSLLNEQEREYLEKHIGFPDCAIDGIIPPSARNLPADVTAEPYYEWDARKDAFREPLPEIEGLNIVDDLTPYLERKLFTLNGPNAVTGALGFMKGYHTVQQALADPEIYDLVWSMMEEAGQMLQKRHGFTEEETLRYRTFIMKRFLNEHVPDSCERVAREPARKLARNDRIVAAMRHAQEYGIQTPAYYRGIAAVMAYDNPGDAQSQEIQEMIRKSGFAAALEKLTGIEAGTPESDAICSEYRELRENLGIERTALQ